jgi:peptidoglycan/LPS O-acetylase OafA/YrhL
VFFYSVLWRMALEASGLIPFFIFWFAPMIATVALALASSRWFERPVGRAITGWHEGVLSRRYPGLTPAE